jgi:hypothetical protein
LDELFDDEKEDDEVDEDDVLFLPPPQPATGLITTVMPAGAGKKRPLLLTPADQLEMRKARALEQFAASASSKVV